MPITSLADLKRRIQVGVIFRCEHHTRPDVSGRRRVVKVQSNSFYYELLDGACVGKQGWVQYPKVCNLQFDNNSVTFINGGVRADQAFTYHFDQEDS